MIQFILNRKTIRTSANPGMTLLDFIRQDEQLKGTKIGCREGDCGACTVLVGELNEGVISYKSITSCISPLGNANGKHVVTIEGVNLPEELNIPQQAMTDNYATQCGFCTPGFVVSLTGYALQKTSEGTGNCHDALSGNICRCTGYKSIEKAAENVDKELINKHVNKPTNWLIEKKFIPHYFEYIPKELEKLQLDEIRKEGTVVAGGTDLYVRDADILAEEKVQLTGDDELLKGICFSENKCTIGANTTVTELLQNDRLRTIFPELKKYMKLVSSEQIRNMGTLGGNFVNASPIGDMSIFFLGLNSTLTLVHKDGSERAIPFQKFHKNYKLVDLRKDELVKSITFNIPSKNTHFNFEKVSKRTHLDIASVNASCSITLDKEVITAAHFAVGGVFPTPKYLSLTNEFLTGKVIDENNIKEAEKILQSEIAPISDVRGSDAYKRLLARQLFFVHFLELFPNRIQFQKLTAL